MGKTGINCTITEKQKQFLDKRGIKASVLLRHAIKERMEEVNYK